MSFTTIHITGISCERCRGRVLVARHTSRKKTPPAGYFPVYPRSQGSLSASFRATGSLERAIVSASCLRENSTERADRDSTPIRNPLKRGDDQENVPCTMHRLSLSLSFSFSLRIRRSPSNIRVCCHRQKERKAGGGEERIGKRETGRELVHRVLRVYTVRSTRSNESERIKIWMGIYSNVQKS